MQEHDDKMHLVRFCGRVLKEAEMHYHPAEKEVLALLLLLKTCYTQLADRTIHVYTRFSTLEVKEKDCAFAQLLQAGLTCFVDLKDSLATVTPLTKGSSTVRMDPQSLYARLPQSYSGLVVSFDGSAKTEKYGGYGSCSWIVWRLPDWTIVTAASAYLEATTVNMAEYSGMNNGVQAALDIGATDLVIVGDSRLAIQQSLGVIACKKESLMTQLNRHRELVARLKSLHVVREYNASADSLAAEALENKASNVISDEPRLVELRSLNRIQEVIYAPITESSADESSVSIAQAQVQTRHLRHMEPLQARSKPKRVKFADETSVTGGEDVTQREEANVRQKTELSRVTAPNGNTPALPGGRGPPNGPKRTSKKDRDCSGRGVTIVLRGEESTLTYRAARDAWKISDHFVLSEDSVLYYVGTRPLRSDQQQKDAMPRLYLNDDSGGTTELSRLVRRRPSRVARTFYRVKLDYYWIGLYAGGVARHVRSCRNFSSSKSRSTIRGYAPGNILAERPFQVVSMDFVIPLPKSRRGNTALLLFQCAFTGYMMGKAMADTTALRVAQAFEECVYRRFGAPSLIRHDRDPRFMSEVFQSFTEMMQSRVKRKVEEFAYKLELPDRSGYRFYPVVHVSRLKTVDEFGDRPSARLIQDVNEATRLDFDEELLPEDRWEPDHVAGEFEVEVILDDRIPLSNSTERAVREFKVKWVGYDDPTWEPASNLSCSGLLYDYLREKRRDRRLQISKSLTRTRSGR
ncbi:LOW QUALITY PROTEIN: hypothetical protein PHMEG_00026851 [Phytophthora megakarya]|uniref:Uncharacterized protein n=1 Tax=Phytophthora megakarya TaxID=4795 RepID=A0A225V9S2_9STRA|nr:LOW QUALITY PROTEIN: hypothetical protein PHMEG_00026851 [Phytophthora megakarya]